MICRKILSIYVAHSSRKADFAVLLFQKVGKHLIPFLISILMRKLLQV